MLAVVLGGCGSQQVAPTTAQPGDSRSCCQPPRLRPRARQWRTRLNPAVGSDFALQDRLIQLYAQANPSVVYIINAPVGSGTGFVYDDQGHIVTNDHVVEGARTLEVVFANGERRAADVVGTDADGDLAVIKVESLPAGVRPLPLAAADDIAVGQFVVAIGNPFGEQGSMSLGIVSGLGRSLSSQRPR